jgi:hypothetical protein
VRFIRAPTVMLAARQAVLLTPSKSLGPTQLLSCQQNAAVSPLLAALTSSSDPSHSIAFSRPLFSYSYELFCASEITTLLFSCKSKLFRKNIGGGVHSPIPELLTTNDSLPTFRRSLHQKPKVPLFIFNSLRTILHLRGRGRVHPDLISTEGRDLLCS